MNWSLPKVLALVDSTLSIPRSSSLLWPWWCASDFWFVSLQRSCVYSSCVCRLSAGHLKPIFQDTSLNDSRNSANTSKLFVFIPDSFLFKNQQVSPSFFCFNTTLNSLPNRCGLCLWDRLFESTFTVSHFGKAHLHLGLRYVWHGTENNPTKMILFLICVLLTNYGCDKRSMRSRTSPWLPLLSACVGLLSSVQHFCSQLSKFAPSL